MGLTNMNLLFLCLLAPIILTSVDTSLAAPSLFDDTYDPAYHEFFSDDQTDQNRAAFEDPLEFTTSLINIQDFSPIASDDHLDWTTDDTTYLDSSGDYFASQLNVDFVTANPACSYDEFSIQGFEKRGQLFPNSCPNPLAPDADTPPSNRKKKQTPTIEPAEPASPPGLNNPGRPFFEHADLGDFYSNRDRDTIQGYSPGKESNSPCGKAQYTVCDSGDPYWRIPQVPPLFALERCFVCKYAC